MKRVLNVLKKVLSSKLTIIIPLILVQIVMAFMFLRFLANYYIIVDVFFRIITLLVSIYVVRKKQNAAYKIAWIIVISSIPIVGGILFVILGGVGTSGKFLKKVAVVEKHNRGTIKKNQDFYDDLWEKDISAAKQAKYLYNTVGLTMYENTKTKYFPLGELFFDELLDDLRKAKHHIFIEIFILEPGIMWDTILAVLKQKVEQGVDVRLVYDDFGCLLTLPTNYYKTMRDLGIKSYPFNEINPVLSLKHNNRDHRKMMIIDGVIAYTGGCNIADEYINGFKKFGHWKDTMVRLQGDAVEGFSMLFLQTWEALSGENMHDKAIYDTYKPTIHQSDESEGGYLIPYGDSPLDQVYTGEMVYTNMINNAKDYIYICTPYFIVGDELLSSIKAAAKSGVSVKMITPYIPDKILIHKTTHSYYEDLLSANVEIFEYEPGFIHSKTMVVDGKIAAIGTVNFDYRSLYLHFECGVWMYKTKAVEEIREDFLKTLEISIPYTKENQKKVGFFEGILKLVLRALSPLM